jgi:hypothetical protein
MGFSMQVIDLSSPNDKERPEELEEKMFRIWISGSERDKDLQAEEVLAAQLAKFLDNSYTLVRGVELPGMDIRIPLVLVGPMGMKVFNASGLTGIFRVRQDSWEAVSGDGQKFTPTRPNIIVRTLLMSQLLEDYLANTNLPGISAQPTLYFSQAGIDVEIETPAVDIVLADSLEQFINQMVESPEALNVDQINGVLDALLKTAPGRSQIDFAKPTSKKIPKLVGFGKYQLLYWQWFVLGTMVFIQILLVISFVFFVLITN